MTIVHYRGTRAGLKRILQSIPAIVAGSQADPGGVVQAIQLRCGVALLSQIQQDFITKSRGGTGRDGVTWKPLRPETIAQRRTTAAERKAAGVGGRNSGHRGLLTEAENRRWRAIFASRVAMLRAKGVANAAAIAAAIAWAALKAQGAKTKLALFGGRRGDIGRDTSAMFRSLTPGVDDKPSGAEDQIFETIPGAVIVGSSKPYFPAFNRVRQVFPTDGTIPAAWWDAINAAAKRGLVAVITNSLRGSR
jgi:hypothetical protein